MSRKAAQPRKPSGTPGSKKSSNSDGFPSFPGTATKYDASSTSMIRKMFFLVLLALLGSIFRAVFVENKSGDVIIKDLMSGFSRFNVVIKGLGLESIIGTIPSESDSNGNSGPSRMDIIRNLNDLPIEEREKILEEPYSNYMKRKISFPVPPEVRPGGCAAKESQYEPGTQKVSIVIPYLREKWVHIRGTVASILANTPQKMLAEIVFISDGNTDEEAHENRIKALDPFYIKKADRENNLKNSTTSSDSDNSDSDAKSIIRVIRLPHRHGLIYAKELGAREAKGDVIMFFEPHCIVNKNWLEPLLHILDKRPNSLVLPTLDYIPQTDFTKYNRAAMGRYRFEWNFNLIYTNPPTGVDGNTDSPHFAPATSGGIFAVKKARFLELKLFDVGMKQWGGDQIELSFKAWRCGGSIIVVPCSRVGHLFRDPEHRPYPVDIPQVVENYAKLAQVWLEPPYLESFYKVKPESRDMNGGNLSVPRSNFQSLQCKSMHWYINNVDLELGWEVSNICIPGAPKDHPHGCGKGRVAAKGRSTVWETMDRSEYLKWAERSEEGFFGAGAWDRWFKDIMEDE